MKAFSESGRRMERIDGKTRSSPCVSGQTSRSTTSAWRESGTSCGRRIFIRSAGIRHVADGQMISFRLMYLTSPGRTIVSARNFRAALERRPAIVLIYTEPSTRLAVLSSVIAGTMSDDGRRSRHAAHMSDRWSREAWRRPVGTRAPITPRKLLGGFAPPAFSYFLRMTRISAGVISEIGRFVRGDARSSRSQLILIQVASAAPLSSRFAGVLRRWRQRYCWPRLPQPAYRALLVRGVFALAR